MWAQNYQAETKSKVLFVSANQWDAIGATWFGFTTCWINRNSHTPEELDVAPHIRGHAFGASNGTCERVHVLTALFTGLSIGLGSGVAPGPLTGLAISTTLRSGLRPGLQIAIAPLISDSIIIFLSLTLVSQLPETAITVLGDYRSDRCRRIRR